MVLLNANGTLLKRLKPVTVATPGSSNFLLSVGCQGHTSSSFLSGRHEAQLCDGTRCCVLHKVFVAVCFLNISTKLLYTPGHCSKVAFASRLPQLIGITLSSHWRNPQPYWTRKELKLGFVRVLRGDMRQREKWRLS